MERQTDSGVYRHALACKNVRELSQSEERFKLSQEKFNSYILKARE